MFSCPFPSARVTMEENERDDPVDLKTSADQNYLILVYLTMTADGFVNYKATTATDDQRMRFQRLMEHGYIEYAGNGYCRLTSSGISAAKEAQEICEQAAERSCADRSKHLALTKRELLVATVSGLICSALTLLAQLLAGLLLDVLGVG